MTGLDSRGLPISVIVEASSLFEAAAAAIEELHKQKCPAGELQIVVHEPGRRFTVRPRQLEKWLRSYSLEDSVGLRALKTRVGELLKHSPSSAFSKRAHKRSYR